jgi:hypothetical protein
MAMRPCQKCSAAIGNGEEVCPRCSHRQSPTVSIQTHYSHSPLAPDKHASDEKSPAKIDDEELPGVVIWLGLKLFFLAGCVILMPAIMLYFAGPAGAVITLMIGVLAIAFVSQAL